MNARKVLAILLAALVMMSTAACSKKSEAPVEPVGGTEVQIPAPSETPVETPAEKEEEKPGEQPTEKPTEKPDEAPKKTEAPTAKPTENPVELPKETPNIPSETPTEAPQPKTDGQKLLADFMSKAGSGNALSVAEALSKNSLIPFSAAAMPVEPGFLSGFGNTEILGFSEGAMFGPIIGAVPFIGYVFTLADGTDAASFVSTLKNSADLRWNICVEAEEMTTGSAGNKVFFVMCNRDLNSEE